MNLASSNFYNFASNETLREKAVAALRTYGVGPCGPPNFYGTQDVHMQTEADVAAHLGVPACIVYAQAFSTITSVIPAFSKRGDIIVADKAVNYSIRKGIQLSRSTVYWYEHNDMDDLERVLQRIVKQFARKPLTRRFIVAEGLYENVGDMVDLTKLARPPFFPQCPSNKPQIQLKTRYKFRAILDETWSYGILGATGRGATEYHHVDPASVDMIIGSLSGALCAGGGFCAGAQAVVEHQRISSTAYTFSAALPAMLATTASETVRMLAGGPELILGLREAARTVRAQLDPRSEWARCTSAGENPVLVLVFKEEVVRARGLGRGELEMLWLEVVEECLANGVLVARLRPMPQVLGAGAKEVGWQPEPALKVCVTTGLAKKELEKAGTVIRHAITKVMTRKK
jgi:serine palmitoyltransferase